MFTCIHQRFRLSLTELLGLDADLPFLLLKKKKKKGGGELIQGIFKDIFNSAVDSERFVVVVPITHQSYLCVQIKKEKGFSGLSLCVIRVTGCCRYAHK